MCPGGLSLVYPEKPGDSEKLGRSGGGPPDSVSRAYQELGCRQPAFPRMHPLFSGGDGRKEPCAEGSGVALTFGAALGGCLLSPHRGVFTPHAPLPWSQTPVLFLKTNTHTHFY